MEHSVGGFGGQLAGHSGAYVADALLQWLGIAAVALLVPFGISGLRLLRGSASAHASETPWLMMRPGWFALALLLLATGLGLLPQSSWFRAPVASGWGGGVGTLIRSLFASVFARAEWMQWLWTPALVVLPAGLIALLWALALDRQSFAKVSNSGLSTAGSGLAGLTHKLAALFRRTAKPGSLEDDNIEETSELPSVSNGPRPKVRREPGMAEPNPRVVTKTEATKRGQREGREKQGALALGDDYVLPSLDLLTTPPKERAKALDNAALEKNARFLETVLQDFGVDGRIVEVRPGPVVTLYELEPAPGIKASRIIGLADDIARSMSAISARVAVIPGRNVIGIELPNKSRDTVYLRDLMASDAFEA